MSESIILNPIYSLWKYCAINPATMEVIRYYYTLDPIVLERIETGDPAFPDWDILAYPEVTGWYQGILHITTTFLGQPARYILDARAEKQQAREYALLLASQSLAGEAYNQNAGIFLNIYVKNMPLFASKQFLIKFELSSYRPNEVALYKDEGGIIYPVDDYHIHGDRIISVLLSPTEHIHLKLYPIHPGEILFKNIEIRWY